MKTQVILVDWENVQPELLPALNLPDTRVWVFLGPHQTKLPVTVVKAVQLLGDRAQYITVIKQGKDALDMHIAFYIGRLTAETPDVFVNVIAKDRDYDPLIAHLKELNIGAAKWPDLASIPSLKSVAARAPGGQLAAALDWLKERKAGRPKTLKTLTNSLKTSVLGVAASAEEISAVLDGLKENGSVVVQGQKLSYPGFSDA